MIRGEIETAYSPTDITGYELGGNAALFQGDYKIVLNIPPVGDNEWHLYNIITDPGETEDLGKSMPERKQQMLERYHAYAAANGVLPVPANYNATAQGIFNGVLDRFGGQILLVLLAFVTLVPFYIAYRSRRK